MTTPSQNKEIFDFLFRKNLPLDLLVEISDHIKEQIEYKIDFENKDFEVAFDETKTVWESDLSLEIGAFSFGKYKTKIQRETEKLTNKEKTLETLKYFFPYFFLTFVFMFINPLISKYLTLIVNVFVGFFCTLIAIKDYKIVNTGSLNYQKKISIFQRKMTFVTIGWQTLFFYVLFYNDRFEKFEKAFYSLIDINIAKFLMLLLPFLYVYAGIYGILNYFEYKKAIQTLKKKTGLKL